jgi:hypothetical protein
VQGTVLGPDGRPVKGAAVRFDPPRGWNRPTETETDAQGHFTVRALPAGKRTFVGQHAAFAPALLELELGTDVVEGEIRLDPPNALIGRIQDREGKAVAGVEVAVERWRENTLLTWKGKSQEDGRFLWPSAPSDTVHLSFTGPKEYVALHDYPLVAGQDHTVVLPPAFLISGTVTDKATGKPIAGCRVSHGFRPLGGRRLKGDPPRWLYAMHETPRPWKVTPVTAADGTYELKIESAAPGWGIVVNATIPGYGRLSSKELPFDQGDQIYDISLAATRELAGTVLRPDRQPADGTLVCLVRSNRAVVIENGFLTNTSHEESVTVGKDGQFRFPGQDRGWRLVAVSDAGYVETHKDSFPADGKLVLQPWARIEGTCKLDGKPVPGSRVEVEPSFSLSDFMPPSIEHSFWADTDADGRFVMPRVPTGLQSVRARLGERRKASLPPSRGRVVEVLPGKTCRLDFGGGGHTVVGSLALAEGIAGPIAWDQVQIAVGPSAAMNLQRPKPPAGWANRSMEEKVAYLKTDEGKAYMAALKAYPEARMRASCKSRLPLCRVNADKDAHFQVPDLPPGEYSLCGTARLPVPEGEDPKKATILSATSEFTIPAERTDKPLDLGTLALKVRPTEQ